VWGGGSGKRGIKFITLILVSGTFLRSGILEGACCFNRGHIILSGKHKQTLKATQCEGRGGSSNCWFQKKESEFSRDVSDHTWTERDRKVQSFVDPHERSKDMDKVQARRRVTDN